MARHLLTLYRFHKNGAMAMVTYNSEMGCWIASASRFGRPTAVGEAVDFEDAKRLADKEAHCPNCMCDPWGELPAQ
jgi:hypothetical protein